MGLAVIVVEVFAPIGKQRFTINFRKRSIKPIIADSITDPFTVAY